MVDCGASRVLSGQRESTSLLRTSWNRIRERAHVANDKRPGIRAGSNYAPTVGPNPFMGSRFGAPSKSVQQPRAAHKVDNSWIAAEDTFCFDAFLEAAPQAPEIPAVARVERDLHLVPGDRATAATSNRSARTPTRAVTSSRLLLLGSAAFAALVLAVGFLKSPLPYQTSWLPLPGRAGAASDPAELLASRSLAPLPSGSVKQTSDSGQAISPEPYPAPHAIQGAHGTGSDYARAQVDDAAGGAPRAGVSATNSNVRMDLPGALNKPSRISAVEADRGELGTLADEISPSAGEPQAQPTNVVGEPPRAALSAFDPTIDRGRVASMAIAAEQHPNVSEDLSRQSEVGPRAAMTLGAEPPSPPPLVLPAESSVLALQNPPEALGPSPERFGLARSGTAEGDGIQGEEQARWESAQSPRPRDATPISRPAPSVDGEAGQEAQQILAAAVQEPATGPEVARTKPSTPDLSTARDLVLRAESLLALGDLSAARLFLKRASDLGLTEAGLRLQSLATRRGHEATLPADRSTPAKPVTAIDDSRRPPRAKREDRSITR